MEIKKMIVKCPKCGIESTDDDFNNGKEHCSFWQDNKGNGHFECWECEKKWVEKVNL